MALKNRRWGAVLKRPAFSFTDSSHATTTRHHRCTLKPQPSPTQDPRSHSLTLASFSISQNAYHHGPPRHNPGKDSPRGSVLPETVEETLTTEGRKGYNRRHAASFDLAKRDLGPAEGYLSIRLTHHTRARLTTSQLRLRRRPRHQLRLLHRFSQQPARPILDPSLRQARRGRLPDRLASQESLQRPRRYER